VNEFGLMVMDASRPVEVQQRRLRTALRPFLGAAPVEIPVHGTV